MRPRYQTLMIDPTGLTQIKREKHNKETNTIPIFHVLLQIKQRLKNMPGVLLVVVLPSTAHHVHSMCSWINLKQIAATSPLGIAVAANINCPIHGLGWITFFFLFLFEFNLRLDPMTPEKCPQLARPIAANGFQRINHICLLTSKAKKVMTPFH